MKLDILAIAAHPDDVELSASGTLIGAVARGMKVGILDLTRGEMGTRGTPETRQAEALAAAKIMGLSARDNAVLPDGFLSNTREQQMAILPFIRKYRPRIVLTNAIEDRHPDHGKAAKLVSDACFLSGLKAIVTRDAEGNDQKAWRPEVVYHFIQDRYIKPDFVVDISAHFEGKMKAIRAYETQFYSGVPQDPDEVTPISTPGFLQFLEARAREMGRLINVDYGEGFTTERPLGIDDLGRFL